MTPWNSGAGRAKVLEIKCLQMNWGSRTNLAATRIRFFSDCPIDDFENEVQRHVAARTLTNKL
jgi:hypothetical protein